MASKYVPPAMRNNKKEEDKPRYMHSRRNYKSQWEIEQEEAEQRKKNQEQEAEKKREINEENFPSLNGDLPAKMSVWGGKKSFASLATEWDEKSKKDEVEKQLQEKEVQSHEMYRRSNIPLPKFYNVHRFVEPEDSTPEQEEQKQEESEWKLVDHRKYRREKSIEEIANRPPTPEETTVWNDEDHHETCWDETR